MYTWIIANILGETIGMVMYLSTVHIIRAIPCYRLQQEDERDSLQVQCLYQQTRLAECEAQKQQKNIGMVLVLHVYYTVLKALQCLANSFIGRLAVPGQLIYWKACSA